MCAEAFLRLQHGIQSLGVMARHLKVMARLKSLAMALALAQLLVKLQVQDLEQIILRVAVLLTDLHSQVFRLHFKSFHQKKLNHLLPFGKQRLFFQRNLQALGNLAVP